MAIFFIVDYSKIIIIILAFCPLIKNYPHVLQDEKNQVMQVNLWIRQVLISFRDVFQINSPTSRSIKLPRPLSFTQTTDVYFSDELLCLTCRLGSIHSWLGTNQNMEELVE